MSAGDELNKRIGKIRRDLASEGEGLKRISLPELCAAVMLLSVELERAMDRCDYRVGFDRCVCKGCEPARRLLSAIHAGATPLVEQQGVDAAPEVRSDD